MRITISVGIFLKCSLVINNLSASSSGEEGQQDDQIAGTPQVDDQRLHADTGS